MNNPLISVIIPTYAREAPLRDTLADVLKQEYPRFEVLVVDQTQTHEPATQTYLNHLSTQGKIRLFSVKWASLTGARNYAIRRALGDVILFIDDDVLLPKGFLSAHARSYINRPEIGGVAGRVLDRQKLAKEKEGMTIDYLPPEAMDPAVGLYYINLVHTIKPQRVITARGCNMSFRREVFEKYGLRFDERFRGSAIREESDFCLSLRQTGLQIWYNPEAALVHLGEETGGCHDLSKRSITYQIAFYHNHFLMGFKHLNVVQALRFFTHLFEVQVLGRFSTTHSSSLIKIALRSVGYSLGFLSSLGTLVQALWNDGQTYSRLDRLPFSQSPQKSQQVSEANL